MNDNPEKVSKTLADSAYQKIRGDIIEGELKADEKLRLSNLCKKYEIGMSPLREALARLIGDALVITEGQRGFWVAPLSVEEFEDISKIRTLLECEALQISMQNSDDTWKEELKIAFDELSRIEAELDGRKRSLVHEWEKANRHFHKVLVSRCNSAWMKRIINQLILQSERYIRISLVRSNDNRNIHDEHEAIYEAAMQGNILKACRLVDLHQSLTTTTVREALQEVIQAL